MLCHPKGSPRGLVRRHTFWLTGLRGKQTLNSSDLGGHRLPNSPGTVLVSKPVLRVELQAFSDEGMETQ